MDSGGEFKDASKSELVLHGLGTSPGRAHGKAFVYRDLLQQQSETVTVSGERVPEELARVDSAFDAVFDDLKESAQRTESRLGKDFAAIFEAHQAMLQDPVFKDSIRTLIVDDHQSAHAAVQEVFRRWERKFLSLEDEHYRQRADDVADLGRKVLKAILGIKGHTLELIPTGSVVVAESLLPSDVVFVDPSRVVGIVVEEGGVGSHSALLARALEIPQVAQVNGLLDQVKDGDIVLVDGTGGRVTLRPRSEEQLSFDNRTVQLGHEVDWDRGQVKAPAVTKSACHVRVMANIGNRHDAELALENGADGVGLYRTEAYYLRMTHLPTEDELYEEMHSTLECMKGLPIYVRLLDIGGDKELPYIRQPLERDPFLGRRGVRLLLDFPELLRSQLRAIVQLSKTFRKLRILIPMVTDIDEIRQVKRMYEECCRNESEIGSVSFAAMIETPAAALFAREICEEVEFLSIGTNDLTQYTMAAARGNPLVSRYYEERHPAVMRMVQLIGDAARTAKTPVSVCGTLAAWDGSVQGLLDCGINSLSVSPRLIPTIKRAVRRAN